MAIVSTRKFCAPIIFVIPVKTNDFALHFRKFKCLAALRASTKSRWKVRFPNKQAMRQLAAANADTLRLALLQRLLRVSKAGQDLSSQAKQGAPAKQRFARVRVAIFVVHNVLRQTRRLRHSYLKFSVFLRYRYPLRSSSTPICFLPFAQISPFSPTSISI